MVVSKGDDDLLKFHNRTGWHFPLTAEGLHDGHPPDDRAAIKELEATRARGAGYLVIPAFGDWWLTHYADFARHLNDRYRVVYSRPDVGVIFDLIGDEEVRGR
ncbi:MAG TPA: hypothetical protein VH120_12320, partial [Gemmataceae bacterium]|nr:hypothetical protein [Gemmataceae bacterium]